MKALKIHFNLIWVLTILSPLFIFALFLVRFSPATQFQILVLSAIVYLAVALLYHYQEKTLRLEIIIEYVLIVFLALLLLQGLIL